MNTNNSSTIPTTQQLFSFFASQDLHLSLIFPRNILLDDEKYKTICENIHLLKIKGFKSYYLSTLINDKNSKQKWPLINLVRQLFKVCGYHLKPFRVSDGYSKTGKKLYKRYFKIEKMPEVKDNTPQIFDQNNDENETNSLEQDSSSG